MKLVSLILITTLSLCILQTQAFAIGLDYPIGTPGEFFGEENQTVEVYYKSKRVKASCFHKSDVNEEYSSVTNSEWYCYTKAPNIECPNNEVQVGTLTRNFQAEMLEDYQVFLSYAAANNKYNTTRSETYHHTHRGTERMFPAISPTVKLLRMGVLCAKIKTTSED